jgi:hypothetical protein
MFSRLSWSTWGPSDKTLLPFASQERPDRIQLPAAEHEQHGRRSIADLLAVSLRRPKLPIYDDSSPRNLLLTNP